MNDKIMFDRYYCINSKKTHQKLRNTISSRYKLAVKPASTRIYAIMNTSVQMELLLLFFIYFYFFFFFHYYYYYVAVKSDYFEI